MYSMIRSTPTRVGNTSIVTAITTYLLVYPHTRVGNTEASLGGTDYLSKALMYPMEVDWMLVQVQVIDR